MVAVFRWFSWLSRETGIYAAIIALCVGVVLWAPYFLEREDARYQPISIDQSDQGETPLLDLPVNDRGDTALHLAVREGNTEKIVNLIEQNADPSIKNKEGVTPLDLAHARGQEDIIGLLTRGSFRSKIPAENDDASLGNR